MAIFLTVTSMAMLSLLGLYLILLKARVGLKGPQGHKEGAFVPDRDGMLKSMGCRDPSLWLSVNQSIYIYNI